MILRAMQVAGSPAGYCRRADSTAPTPEIGRIGPALDRYAATSISPRRVPLLTLSLLQPSYRAQGSTDTRCLKRGGTDRIFRRDLVMCAALRQMAFEQSERLDCEWLAGEPCVAED